MSDFKINRGLVNNKAELELEIRTYFNPINQEK